MLKVKLNKSKVSASIKEVEGVVEDALDERLQSIAFSLVDFSPVWSGAYVKSHSFVPKGSGAGRRRQNRRDSPTDEQGAKSEALSLLYGDIAKVNMLEAGGGVFRNRSPHARLVEDGQFNGQTMKYGPSSVYTRVANKYG